MPKDFTSPPHAQAARGSRNLPPAQTSAAHVTERVLGNRRSAQQAQSVGQRNDRFERQADAVAAQFGSDEIADAPVDLATDLALEFERNDEPPLQLKSLPGSATPSVAPGMATVGPGHALSPTVRQPFEQRFGYRLDQVRIHDGAAAASSAARMHARAYTAGAHIVFGRGEFSPHTTAGQQLLAHELTHVMQQGAISGAPKVQRAETDEEVKCSSLVDCSSDINTEVNRVLGIAVGAAGKPPDANKVVDRVASDLGGSLPVSPIENWAEKKLPANKIHQAAISDTRYRGADTGLWSLFSRVLGPIVKIGKICVGTDKLGHFFQQGFQYFEIARRITGATVADAEAAGRNWEMGGSGLATTGVFSNADLDANRKGLQFYDDLLASPKMKFDIAKYANDNWNEQAQPNFYTSSMATIVWNNLLGKPLWRGFFENNFTGVGGQPVEVDFDVSATGAITAKYEYDSAGTVTKGTISNVNLTQRTTSVTGTTGVFGTRSATPVAGIGLTFTWTEGSSVGQGAWESLNEGQLVGTWGRGGSAVDGGAWNIDRV